MANMYGRIPRTSFDMIKPIFETCDALAFEKILEADPDFKHDAAYAAFYIASVCRDFRWEEQTVGEAFKEMCDGIGIPLTAMPPEAMMREALADKGIRI